MKLQKLTLVLFFIGALAALALSGCKSAAALSASSQAAPGTLRQIENNAPQPVEENIEDPVVEKQETPLPVVAPPPLKSSYPPGALLTTANGNRIVMIGADGKARAIQNWTLFYALGLKRSMAQIISAEELEALPAGEALSRLLLDKDGYYCWAVNGALWAIDDWQDILTANNAAATTLDPILALSMPRVSVIPDRVLLKDEKDGNKLYIKQGGFIYPLASPSLHRTFGYRYLDAIDAPSNVLSPYNFKPALTRFLKDGSSGHIYEIVKGKRRLLSAVELAADFHQEDTPVVAHNFLQAFPAVLSLTVSAQTVNLRAGPDLNSPVIAQAAQNRRLTPIARLADNSWFQIRYQAKTLWVAGSVIEIQGDPAQLAVVEAPLVEAEASPTPTATPASLTPLYCDPVPIRGFGKVWAEHLEVQHLLRCPRRTEQGINAAVQQFQHGVMIWVEQDNVWGSDPVYVLFDDHTYQRFGNMRPADPAKVGAVPAGFHPIGDKFSAIYWEGTGARVKERLGFAITAPADSSGAFQVFRNGRMFWLGILDRIYVVQNYPQTWSDYEDTF